MRSIYDTLCQFVLRFRIPIIVITVLITIAAAYFIKDISINADIMSYLPKNDPVSHMNSHISEEYGASYMGIVAVESDNLFSEPVINAITEMTEEFEMVEGVLQVTSIVNSMDIKKTEDGFAVGKLTEDDWGEPLPLSLVKERALTHRLFRPDSL